MAAIKHADPVTRSTSGRWRPMDTNSPIVIPSPTLPPTPLLHQAHRKRSNFHGVGDDALPAGLIRTDRTTPQSTKSPLNVMDVAHGSPRGPVSKGHPTTHVHAAAMRHVISNDTQNKAMYSELLKILERRNQNSTSTMSSTNERLFAKMAQLLSGAESTPSVAAVDNKEIASLVARPVSEIAAPKPSGHLVAKDIELLQRNYTKKPPSRITRSTNSAFSESSPSVKTNE